MEKVRIGIIGLGNMGTGHTKYLVNNEVKGGQLTAICEFRADRLEWAKENLGEGIQLFDDLDAFLNSGVIDSVLIATPHYDHPEVAIKAFKAGLHVLCEKPAGVYTKQVRQMNEAAAASGKVFSMMYNQRTNPLYKKLKDLVDSGE